MILKKILTNIGPLPLVKNNFINTEYCFGKNFKIMKFGKKNPKKIFYIIRRNPGAGLFSNVTVILNHILICKRMNFIPVIDMENFKTIYNEPRPVMGINNAWEYYFEKLNKYSLAEVYKSKNVIISNSNLENHMINDMTNNLLNKYFKLIKIKKKFYDKANIFSKKNFKNQKILGVHFRGSTYKVARGHAFPLTTKLIIEEVNKLIKKFGYQKIFLVTEENDYLKEFVKEYGEKCIYYKNFRMEKADLFKIYPRKLHRFKLGEEILIDTLLLSKCNGLAYIKSNVISAAMLLAKKNQKFHEFFLGYNSRNKFISRWLWYVKSCIPGFLGGLKIIKK